MVRGFLLYAEHWPIVVAAGILPAGGGGILPLGVWLSILETENFCWITLPFPLGLEARLTGRQDACRHRNCPAATNEQSAPGPDAQPKALG